MSNNIRPIALTATQAKQLAHGARTVWDRALEEVTRGLDDPLPGRPDARAVRHELALEMYRIAMRELGEVLPAIAEFDFAEETPQEQHWPYGIIWANSPAGPIVFYGCEHGVGDHQCTRCNP